MERFQELREVAKKKIQIADHMLTMTYPMVKDPRLLLAVLENIFLSLTNMMGSVLYHERTFKRVPPFQDNFTSKFAVFKLIAENHKLQPTYLMMIQEIKEIIMQHKKSPVEFIRKDSFVICAEDYDMRTISLEQIKDYISKTKMFFQETTNLLKNERISSRR